MTKHALFHLFLYRLFAWLLLVLGAGALAQADPPGRAASLSQMEGSVALAPADDTEWADAQVNRPITRGDRVWTDPGARAELHLGSAVLHMNSQTFLDVTALDERAFQASLNEGTLNARVRELQGGENFEVDTPQLALRAAQAGDYRIDVDLPRGTTRVTVRSGMVLVYGERGEALPLSAGQQVLFIGRDLEQAAAQGMPLDEDFDRWAGDRNRQEDQSIAARYIPRDVVGYRQLDPYGTWAQDQNYGPIWYPTITITDWAPYRYGHWAWIAPWGWTWIDNAPWGFAPFHYGRWAMIGSRWAWVPGRIGHRPTYAPALVAFAGEDHGATGWKVGASPGIAWFPLAPGEAWRPAYSASALYLRNVNRNIVANRNMDAAYVHQRRPEAVTAVRIDDFRRGRPVHDHWTRSGAADLARVRQAPAQPSLPEPQRADTTTRTHARPFPPRPQAQLGTPIIMGRTQPQMQLHESRMEQHREIGQRPSFAVPRVQLPQPGHPNDEQRLQQTPRQRIQEHQQQTQRERALQQQLSIQHRALTPPPQFVAPAVEQPPHQRQQHAPASERQTTTQPGDKSPPHAEDNGRAHSRMSRFN